MALYPLSIYAAFSLYLSISFPVFVYVCLCLTYTLVILHLIARGADTSEGSIQILTSSRRAGAGQTHTLIDICGKCDHVGIRKCVYISVC